MTITEQNKHNTAPPSPGTGQQSLAGSLSSQPSSSTTRSRKPRSERQSRHKWSDEDKKTLMTLYYRSDPSKSGYRRRLHRLWKDANLFPRTEQQLADQARSIQQNNLLSDIDLLEIRGSISIAPVPAPAVMPKSVLNLEPQVAIDQAIQEIRYNNERPNLTHPQDIPRDSAPQDSALIQEITEQISKLAEEPERIQTKPLRYVNSKRLKEETIIVNKCLVSFCPESITETNTLLLAAAHVVIDRLGEKVLPPKGREKKQPFWKRRIEDKVKELRKDISHLAEILKGTKLKSKVMDDLSRKFPLLKKKGPKCIQEELKQRLRSKAAKIQRFQKRCDRYHQNRTFGNNQRQFYRNLSPSPSTNMEASETNKEACLAFWKNIWGNEATHNTDAQWLPYVREELAKTDDQPDPTITLDHVSKRVKGMANWSSPGLDGLHAFWVKHFTSLHGLIAKQMNKCLTESDVPKWMTKGKTYLIMKDPNKGVIPENFRPITCLPIMWKLLSGILADSMYQHLETQNLIPEEQKGCKRNSRGCKEQLLIDKLVMKHCKRRRKDLYMTFIDYKKAYDSVPHSWLLSSMAMCGISPLIVEFFAASLGQSYVDLFLNNNCLGNIKIRRGIFQGDSVSPLHFVISLLPLSLLLNKQNLGYQMVMEDASDLQISHRLYMDDLKLYSGTEDNMQQLVDITSTFSSDIAMEFGLDKCATININKGKLGDAKSIPLPSGNLIESIDEEGYKYLGILETDSILHKEMKSKVTTEYYRRVKKILRSQLHGRFAFRAINTWAVPVLRYGAGIINWRKDELKNIDIKTRKILRYNGAHHPQGDVDRLYVSREKGGRGLQSIEEVITREENALTTYFKEGTKPMISRMATLMTKEGILKGDIIDKEKDKMHKESIRLDKWTAKVMHGQYRRQIITIADPSSWEWLKQQDLKKETESLIIAAQDQAVRTNYIKHRVDKTTASPLCRLCRSSSETIDHILNGCPKIAQTEYKMRHDKVAAAIHWSLCKRFGFQESKTYKWYEHRAEKVLENDAVKILWDFHVQTDKNIEHCRPDILMVNKREKEAIIIDIAVPGDTRIIDREQDKILVYQDLKWEIKRCWGLRKVKVIPVVVGALGAVSPKFGEYLAKLDCKLHPSNIQKTALLGSARILRMVLDMQN